MTPEQARETIIRQGVKNLKEFGYPSVDEKNILTDMVYSVMFKNMLEDNKEQTTNQTIIKILDGLIEEIVK